MEQFRDQQPVEMVGSVVEGPLTENQVAVGGIKLVVYDNGDIGAINRLHTHPSFARLPAGARVRSRFNGQMVPEPSAETIY